MVLAPLNTPGPLVPSGQAPASIPITPDQTVRFILFTPERARWLREIRLASVNGRASDYTWENYVNRFGNEYFHTTGFLDDARPQALQTQNCAEDKIISSQTFRRAFDKEGLWQYEQTFRLPFILFPFWDSTEQKVRWKEAEYASFASIDEGMLGNAGFNGNLLRSSMTGLKPLVAAVVLDRKKIADVYVVIGPFINPARAGDGSNPFNVEMGHRAMDMFNNCKWKRRIRRRDEWGNLTNNWVWAQSNGPATWGNLGALERMQIRQFKMRPDRRTERVVTLYDELESWIRDPYSLLTLEEYHTVAGALSTLYGDYYLNDGDWDQCYGRIPTYNRYAENYDPRTRGRSLDDLRRALNGNNVILLDVMFKEALASEGIDVDPADFILTPAGREPTTTELMLSDHEKFMLLRRLNFERWYPEWAATLPLTVREYLEHRFHPNPAEHQVNLVERLRARDRFEEADDLEAEATGLDAVTPGSGDRIRILDLDEYNIRTRYLGNSPKEHPYVLLARIAGALHAVCDWTTFNRAYEIIVGQGWDRAQAGRWIFGEQLFKYAYRPTYQLVRDAMTDSALMEGHHAAIHNPNRDEMIRPLNWVADIQGTWIPLVESISVVDGSDRLVVSWSFFQPVKEDFAKGFGSWDLEFQLIEYYNQVIILCIVFDRQYAYVEAQTIYPNLTNDMNVLHQHQLDDVLARKQFEFLLKHAMVPDEGTMAIEQISPEEAERLLKEEFKYSPIIKDAFLDVILKDSKRFGVRAKTNVVGRWIESAKRHSGQHYDARNQRWKNKDEWREYFQGHLHGIMSKIVDPLTGKSLYDLLIGLQNRKMHVYYLPSFDQIWSSVLAQDFALQVLPTNRKVEIDEVALARPKGDQKSLTANAGQNGAAKERVLFSIGPVKVKW